MRQLYLELQEATKPVEVVDMDSILPEKPVEEDVVEHELSLAERLGVEIPDKQIDWEALKEMNPDIYAWIYVPDTTVDYPVLQHPEDDTYYLNYNIDGTRGYPGCIYTELINEKDFSDPNTVLYGHNLRDKTMFSSLHNFAEPELLEENHFIFVYTPDKTFIYWIFGAYEYPGIHLLHNYDWDSPEGIRAYLDQVTTYEGRVANFRRDIPITPYDHLITLSTCTTDHDASLRFLVQGVLVNPQLNLSSVVSGIGSSLASLEFTDGLCYYGNDFVGAVLQLLNIYESILILYFTIKGANQ